MEATRRRLLSTAAVLSAFAVAGCSNLFNGGGGVDVISTIQQLIQKVQTGVANACAHVVPTVDAVFATVEAWLGSPLSTSNLAQAVTFVQKCIDALSAAICPAPSPPASAHDVLRSALKSSPPTIKVNGKDVVVTVY